MSTYDEHPADPETTTELPREPAPAPRRSGWHPVNTGHLVMGVAFAGLTVVWALVASETVKITEAGWILSLPWLAAGAAGLVATVLRGRRHPDHPDDHSYGGYDSGYDHHGYGTRVQGWN